MCGGNGIEEENRGKSLSKLPKFYEYKGCVEKDGDRGRYRAECTQQTHTQNEKSHQRRHSFFVYGCVCTAAADRIHRVGEKKREKERDCTVRVSMKHNPSLIASRLSSLRYSVALHIKPSFFVILLLRYILMLFTTIVLTISVFFPSILLILSLLLFLFRSRDQRPLTKSRI